MKQKRFWVIRPVSILLMLLPVAMCVVLFFVHRLSFYICTPLVIAVVIYAAVKLFRLQHNLYAIVTSSGRIITDSRESGLINFPLPSLLLNASGEIVWYNELFHRQVLTGGREETPDNAVRDLFGKNVRDIFRCTAEDLLRTQGSLLEYLGRWYEAYCLPANDEATAFYLLYLVDVTELEQTRQSYLRERPAVMLVLIDNYEEAIGNENEASQAKLSSEVRGAIQAFADSTSGFIRRLEHDRYLIVVEQGDLDEIIRTRFSVLDHVRQLPTENRVPVTLSIGVAPITTTLQKAEQDARQALDMALGRGGDQAALKTESGYEFFGGYSKGVEKRTKVKTRIVASAMVELIRSADNILIMGHRYGDLDSLGSAIGLARACTCFGKRVNIVLDVRRNLADVLVRRLAEENEQGLLVQPDSAPDLVGDKTLLFIVDTHTAALLESQEAYRRCKQVVIIDHHRKLVHYIDNAVIFYHEPYASSASEMVTELIQYFGDQCRLGNLEADALLAGITLDTKNFVIKTGVRTFEAAAYLRRLGADTVEVRQLFSSTMDSYQRKSRIVSSAEIYKGCAVATVDFASEDLRLVASQAADELLGISGVKASFVLYEDNDAINISARSMGALNVQVIMERLGGGGHHTMAAAQVPGGTCDKVRQSLLTAIDESLQQG